MKKFIGKLSSETGASTVSYTLLLSLIAIAVLSTGGSSSALSRGAHDNLLLAANELGGSTVGTSYPTDPECVTDCAAPTNPGGE